MTTARDTYNQIVYAEEKGLEQGRKEGMEEGEKKKAANIARKMLTKGMDVESIADLTDLTPSEIEGLKGAQVSE